MNTTIANAGSGRGDFHVAYQGQSVDDLIIDYMQSNNIPGMTLAIVQAPYITRIIGYGLIDTQNKRLAATRSLFQLGQLTNAYTVVAIMQLKAEGKLALDDHINQYLTDAPAEWKAISIRQLINHTSGLSDYTLAKDFDFQKDYQSQEIVRLIAEKPLAFSPGAQAQQSASNSYLLGLIIEKASQMRYQEYITKNQIQRLGLQHTFFVDQLAAIQNEVHNGSQPFKHSQFLHQPVFINPTEAAVGYDEINGQLSPVPLPSWSASFASSGIVASAEDVSLWDIGLAGEILIKDQADRAFIYNAITLANGDSIPANAGWFFPGHPGLMEIKGNVPGFSSFLSRFTAPTELLCVTLLANKGNLNDLDILGRKIAGAFDQKLAAPTGAKWSVTLQSPYSVKETIARVTQIIQQRGGKVFAHVDHHGEAIKVGESLPETEVLVIGNPKAGTALMQDNPAIALDLPLRIMATKDSSGQVWLSFTDPVKLGQEYQLDVKLNPRLHNMAHALTDICHQAIGAQ